MVDRDLFGNEIDVFKTALDRYGVWPTTVWECNHQDRKTKRLKETIGDVEAANTARAGCFTKESDDKSTYRGKVTVSIFSPEIAAWLLNCFAPDNGLCFDPFAGGGTRAIMAAKKGLAYLGVELRQAEIDAVNERCRNVEVADSVHIECGDARDCTRMASTASADFLLTCPPYYDLEKYDGGPSDLSMCGTYQGFLGGIQQVVQECHRILKPGANACWVVGLHRDKAGDLLPLHHDIAAIHRQTGFRLREEIVLAHKNNGAIQRVGNFDKGSKRLIRTHEYALVFVR